MCDPVTIMATTAVVSTAFTANQQIQQGKYQEGVAKYNARATENEAQELRNQGVEAENAQREKTAQLLSKQRAQLGASNVDLGSGSALQLQNDTQTLGEVDALRIRSNYDNKYDSMIDSADLIRQQGKDARSASKTAAFGTLLSGAASVSGTGVANNWFTPASAASMSSATANQGLSVTGNSAIPSF